MRKIKNDTPEKAAARLERFLANPPARIAPEKIQSRRIKNIRKGQRAGLASDLAFAQSWKCIYCKRNMSRADSGRPNAATVEHRDPLSRGGTACKGNLAAACKSCNEAKGSMTEQEFRAARGETPQTQ